MGAPGGRVLEGTRSRARTAAGGHESVFEATPQGPETGFLSLSRWQVSHTVWRATMLDNANFADPGSLESSRPEAEIPPGPACEGQGAGPATPKRTRRA